MNGAVVSIYYHLDTVPDVVEIVLKAGGVSVAVGGGIGILNPPQLPLASHHQIRVAIETKEGDYCTHPILYFASELNLAVRGNLPAL